MARVLIVSLVFSPDGVSTAQLVSEVAIDLKRAGHDVSVITTQPHYNRDAVAEAEQPLTRSWHGLTFRSNYHGIPVCHIRMPAKRGSFLRRFPGWFLFHVLALTLGLFGVPRPSVVMVPSPLLTAGVVGWLITVLRGGRFVYNAWELYPDVGIKTGQLKSVPLIRLLRYLEHFVYRKASVVTVLGEGMRQSIIEKGIPADRVVVVPSFVDLDTLKPVPADNAFAREHSLNGDFVVTYAGNMGFAQGLEVLLDAAELLVNEPGIVFVFVGDGVVRNALRKSANDRGLRNTRFIDHQPFARMPEIYAASNLCVIPLVGTVIAEAVPSKVLRIMACGRAALVLADPRSDLAREVCAAGGGVVLPPSSAEAIAVRLRQLNADRQSCEDMGLSARRYVERHYSRAFVTNKYDSMIERLAEAPSTSD